MSWRQFLKTTPEVLRVQRVQSPPEIPLPTLKTLPPPNVKIESTPVSPIPQWQHDFCQACGDYNNWRGCCTKSLNDCLLSRVIDAENDIERLKGTTIGQGVKTDDVLQLWCESGELMDDLFKKPVWLFCIAEHIKQLQIVAEG